MKDKISYHHVTDAPGLTLSKGHFSQFSFDRHYHLDYHIGLMVDGVQRQNFQGKSELIGPGHVVLMPPDEMHDGISHDKKSYIQKIFRISPDMLNAYMAEFADKNSDAKFNGTILKDPQLWSRLIHLHQAIETRQSLAPLSIEETWYLSLEPLFSQLSKATITEVKGGLSTDHKKQVVEYCRAHLSDNISLETLAELCDLNKYQFLRRFKQTLGITPHAWLIRLRLEHACMLFKLGRHNIAQVAADVGFYDQSHFNRAFRQAYGVPPSAYQN